MKQEKKSFLILAEEGEGITSNRKFMDVWDWGKKKNKNEEKGCWVPLRLPCKLIRNRKPFPPKFIFTGADGLGWPEALDYSMYPTVCCQQISTSSFLIFPQIQPSLSTTGSTVWAEHLAASELWSALRCKDRCHTVPSSSWPAQPPAPPLAPQSEPTD